MKWFEWKAADGRALTTKGHNEIEARREAADRLECSEAELCLTGHTPFNARLAGAGRL